MNRIFLTVFGALVASHAVVFRGVVLPSSPQRCGEESNTTPLKTTAWEARALVSVGISCRLSGWSVRSCQLVGSIQVLALIGFFKNCSTLLQFVEYFCKVFRFRFHLLI